MSRIVAREEAFKLTFDYLFSNTVDVNYLKKLLEDDENLDEEDKKYLTKTYQGVIDNLPIIQDVLEKCLIGKTLSSLYNIDKAILYVSIYELLIEKKEDAKVIINEAIKLSKKYSTDKSYKFINGVLASVCKEKIGGEF